MFIRPKKIGLLISFAVLLLVALMLFAFHRFAMQRVIVEFGERQALGISEVLEKNLTDDYSDLLARIAAEKGGKTPAIAPALRREIESFFAPMHIVKAYQLTYKQHSIAQKAIQDGALPVGLERGMREHTNASQDTVFFHKYHGKDGLEILMVVDISDEYNDINSIVKIAFAAVFILILIANILMWVYFSYIEHAIATQQQDISELQEKLHDAEKDSKRRSDFLANVTHELRTPLNAIIGFSEIVNSEAMGPIGNEKYKEFVGDIYASGTHLLHIINDILDYSKIASGRIEVKNDELIDLVYIVRVCIKMIYPKAKEGKVEIVDKIQLKECKVKGDAQRMKQCVLNILSNAVKFTQKNGMVEVNLTSPKSRKKPVILTIKDNGVGMAPQDIARAMEPFGQLDSKLNRKHKGTGLGLPLTARLLELMGWNLTIESEQGSGTTVHLTSPHQ
jgi:signal transduction histidine kinase